MTVSDLIPTLQPTVETISTQLRFICFFVLVAAMIVRTGTGNTDITHLLRPLTTNAIVCAFLATLPFWFKQRAGQFLGHCRADPTGFYRQHRRDGHKAHAAASAARWPN